MFCVVSTSKRRQISIERVQYLDKLFCMLTYFQKTQHLEAGYTFYLDDSL